MSKSTSINNLPNINNLTETAGDEDNTIHEVLAEIQNENEAQLNNGPPVPIESVQQMPPQPNPQFNNVNDILNTNTQNQLVQQQQQQLQQLQQQQMDMNNLNYMYPQQSPSKFNLIINELNKNMKLFAVIIISYILLQNTKLQALITSRLSNVNIPYINTIVLAITQVVIVLFSKIFL
tara:strand:+ start:351 stop:884 length:534 start_codon:yes stop_codon:yes gene_type:complete